MEWNEVRDYDYIASSLGNGFFSGLSMKELWECISVSSTREELDAAVSATVLLKEITGKETK